jgi:hypothetical protein
MFVCNFILSLQFSTFLLFSTFSLLMICLMIFQGCHSMEVNMLIHFHSNLHFNLCWNHFYSIAYTNHLLETCWYSKVHRMFILGMCKWLYLDQKLWIINLRILHYVCKDRLTFKTYVAIVGQWIICNKNDEQLHNIPKNIVILLIKL